MLPALDNLVHALSKLPGFGRRSSERAALALVRRPESLLDNLMQALQEAREQVCICTQCGAFTEHDADPCPLCTRTDRNDHQICVVEDPADIYTLESSGAFKGRYHVLAGKLSPGRQTSMADLRISALLHRIRRDEITEVLLALSTDIEGDATANYIAEKLRDTPTRVTRLAFGLPCGSGIAYADALTLRRAIRGRQSVTDPEDDL
jgi:recombination protein RecR